MVEMSFKTKTWLLSEKEKKLNKLKMLLIYN